MTINCPKCDELNSQLIDVDDWQLCADCDIDIEEFLKLQPKKYIVFHENLNENY